MTSPAGTIWPPLETTYTDEFGVIDPEVYAAAGRLWGQGERYALSLLGDASSGLRLMLKAAAIVTRKRTSADDQIGNLAAYLFQTYKRLVLAELERKNGHRQRETERRSEIEAFTVSLTEDVERKILVQELVGRMDSWMREVFELLALGHSFEEIGKSRGQNANALRARFSKHLKRLTKQIQSGQ